MYKFGFLGLGKMGSSILNGIITKKLYDKKDLSFYAPSAETQNKYLDFGLNLAKDEIELFKTCKIILMAIKPQKYDEVLLKIKDLDFSGKIVISLAPGKSINYLKSKMSGATIVRAMPNTPALINQGVTTIAFEKEEIKEVLDIFSSIGTYVTVEEKAIDEAIPLNGSMPAYVLEFAKAFIECAKGYGFSEDDAKKLALNAIIGSCNLALQSNDDIDTLINNVCSKGGSTIVGLNELRQNGFNEAIKKCYDGCVKRSKELGNV